MKFIFTLCLAGAMAGCSKDYVELDAGSYDFKSNPYTLPVADNTFRSPRQLSIYNKDVETRSDSRIDLACGEVVDRSISYAWAIIPPKVDTKAAKTTKGKKGKNSKNSSTAAPVATPKAPAAPVVDKYPMFNSPLAVNLWKMMRRSDTFTQTDISNAIELCIVAYDYLSQEYEEILGHNYSEAKRRDCLMDLDNGKGSEIMNFSNTFSRRLNKLPDLSEDNLNRLQTMNSKKEHSRALLNRVVEP